MIEIPSLESLQRSALIRKAYGAKCGLTQDSGTVQYVDDSGVRGTRTFFYDCVRIQVSIGLEA